MLRVKAVIQCSDCFTEAGCVLLFSGVARNRPELGIFPPEDLPDGWECSDTGTGDEELMVRCDNCAVARKRQ